MIEDSGEPPLNLETLLKPSYAAIFEEELRFWHRVEADWLRRRTSDRAAVLLFPALMVVLEWVQPRITPLLHLPLQSGSDRVLAAMRRGHDAAYYREIVAKARRARPEELTLEGWEQTIRVNMTGTFLMSVQAGRRMIARGRGGSIINFSSIAGSNTLGRGSIAYGATKRGVDAVNAYVILGSACRAKLVLTTREKRDLYSAEPKLFNAVWHRGVLSSAPRRRK